MYRNDYVVSRYMDGRSVKNTNLKADLPCLISYETPVAVRMEIQGKEYLALSVETYSRSTGRHLGYCRQEARRRDIPVLPYLGNWRPSGSGENVNPDGSLHITEYNLKRILQDMREHLRKEMHLEAERLVRARVRKSENTLDRLMSVYELTRKLSRDGIRKLKKGTVMSEAKRSVRKARSEAARKAAATAAKEEERCAEIYRLSLAHRWLDGEDGDSRDTISSYLKPEHVLLRAKCGHLETLPHIPDINLDSRFQQDKLMLAAIGHHLDVNETWHAGRSSCETYLVLLHKEDRYTRKIRLSQFMRAYATVTGEDVERLRARFGVQP